MAGLKKTVQGLWGNFRKKQAEEKAHLLLDREYHRCLKEIAGASIYNQSAFAISNDLLYGLAHGSPNKAVNLIKALWERAPRYNPQEGKKGNPFAYHFRESILKKATFILPILATNSKETPPTKHANYLLQDVARYNGVTLEAFEHLTGTTKQGGILTTSALGPYNKNLSFAFMAGPNKQPVFSLTGLDQVVVGALEAMEMNIKRNNPETLETSGPSLTLFYTDFIRTAEHHMEDAYLYSLPHPPLHRLIRNRIDKPFLRPSCE